MHDLVIRGGEIFDGTGRSRFVADIAVKDGVIVKVGEGVGAGREETDATGRMVTPGFFDFHTHYDGQAVWDRDLAPSVYHGVTTCVMGNCGVGFAPVVEPNRDALVRFMEGVEDIPGTALHEGLTWEWRSFPDYMKCLSAKTRTMDVAAQIPHGPLRLHVMGADRVNANATKAEIDEMCALVREAIEAGAVGFSTSRIMMHQSTDAIPLPGTFALREELLAIGDVLKETGGVFQVIGDCLVGLYDGDALDAEQHRPHADRPDFPWIEEIAMKGVPVNMCWFQLPGQNDEWRELLRVTERAVSRGAKIVLQTPPRPFGVLISWRSKFNPFALKPSYAEVAMLTHAERVERLKDPILRKTLIEETILTPEEAADRRYAHRLDDAKADGTYDQFIKFNTISRDYTAIYPLCGADGRPNYVPTPGTDIVSMAVAAGRSPEDMLYDIMMEGDGEGFAFLASAHYADGNLDFLETLFQSDNVLPGMSDGGAHVSFICDASMNSFFLSYWGRDRVGTPFQLENLVAKLTAQPARLYGFTDRGQLAPGFRADINIIDFESLQLEMPFFTGDLPSGADRLMQHTGGFTATYVAGRPVARNGGLTGEYPGLFAGRTAA